MAWTDVVPLEMRTVDRLFDIVQMLRGMALPRQLAKVILWTVMHEMAMSGEITPDMARRWSETAPGISFNMGDGLVIGGTSQGWYVEGERIRVGDRQLEWLLWGLITVDEY